MDAAWPALKRLGLSPGASQSNLKFTAELAQAFAGADLVQENGPERIEFKQKLYRAARRAAAARRDHRFELVGTHHERNPVGRRVPSGALRHRPSVQSAALGSAGRDRWRGEDLRSDNPARSGILYVDRAADGAPRKEMPGHVANRLQAALAREVYYLVAEGVVSAADVDTALSWGPGLRWGIMGNMMLNHLGGGPGGIEHFFQQFSGPMTAWWKTLGSPVLTPEVQKKAHRQRSRRGGLTLDLTNWRRSETRSCSGCSSCAPRPRRACDTQRRRQRRLRSSLLAPSVRSASQHGDQNDYGL